MDSKDIVRAFVDGWNSGDLDVYARLVSPDYIDHDPASGRVEPGAHIQRALIAHYRDAFDGFNVAIERMFADPPFVIIQYRARGTHVRPFMGVPPVGRRFEITGSAVYEVRDGVIQSARSNWDTLGMMRQIANVTIAAGDPPAA